MYFLFTRAQRSIIKVATFCIPGIFLFTKSLRELPATALPVRAKRGLPIHCHLQALAIVVGALEEPSDNAWYSPIIDAFRTVTLSRRQIFEE